MSSKVKPNTPAIAELLMKMMEIASYTRRQNRQAIEAAVEC